MTPENLVVAVDFDGTCVQHKYPHMGSDLPGAADVLQSLSKLGVKIILLTMRDDSELTQAVKWFADRSIKLYGVNENPGQKSWTTSPKVYAHIYIDDCGACIPARTANGRKEVDWERVRQWMIAEGIPLDVSN